MASSENEEMNSYESLWLQGNWIRVKENAEKLLQEFEMTRRTRDIQSDMFHAAMEQKQELESSLRRRSKTVKLIKQRYDRLKSTLEKIKTSCNLIVEQSSEVRLQRLTENIVTNPISPDFPPTESYDAFNIPRTFSHCGDASCLERFARRLRNVGLELLDEDGQLSPVVGVGITIAMVIALCGAASFVRSRGSEPPPE